MQFKQMLRSLKNSGFQDFLQLLKLKNTTVRIISSLIQYPQFIYDSFHIGTSFVNNNSIGDDSFRSEKCLFLICYISGNGNALKAKRKAQ